MIEFESKLQRKKAIKEALLRIENARWEYYLRCRFGKEIINEKNDGGSSLRFLLDWIKPIEQVERATYPNLAEKVGQWFALRLIECFGRDDHVAEQAASEIRKMAEMALYVRKILGDATMADNETKRPRGRAPSLKYGLEANFLHASIAILHQSFEHGEYPTKGDFIRETNRLLRKKRAGAKDVPSHKFTSLFKKYKLDNLPTDKRRKAARDQLNNAIPK